MNYLEQPEFDEHYRPIQLSVKIISDFSKDWLFYNGRVLAQVIS